MHLYVELRPITHADLPIIFEYQRDPVANHMVAFTRNDSDDWPSFEAHWKRNLANPENVNRAILANGEFAGTMVSFIRDEMREVGYWLNSAFWSRGIATEALKQFLEIMTERPVYGAAAIDNAGSLRVLAKCGFVPIEETKVWSNARAVDVDIVIHRLD